VSVFRGGGDPFFGFTSGGHPLVGVEIFFLVDAKAKESKLWGNLGSIGHVQMFFLNPVLGAMSHGRDLTASIGTAICNFW